MKKIVLAICFAFAAGLAFAAAPAGAAPVSAQQSKMKTCNADVGDRKGDDRKKFMKECLSAKAAGEKSAKTVQQEKMKTCNKEAVGKKGDERKKFMSECLKK